MVDCGSWRIDCSSVTASSLRSRASRSLLLVGSARADMCPNRVVVIWSIRSSGLKGISGRRNCQLDSALSFPVMAASVRRPPTGAPRHAVMRVGLLVLLACTPPVMAPSPAADGDWPAYGRTPGGDRYSPLTQITRDNV